jgi:hypothetical protein
MKLSPREECRQPAHVKCGRFVRNLILRYDRVFGIGSESVAVQRHLVHEKDSIADSEACNCSSDSDNCAGSISAQDQREPGAEDRAESSPAGICIDRINARRLHSYQYVVVLICRLRTIYDLKYFRSAE